MEVCAADGHAKSAGHADCGPQHITAPPRGARPPGSPPIPRRRSKDVAIARILIGMTGLVNASAALLIAALVATSPAAAPARSDAVSIGAVSIGIASAGTDRTSSDPAGADSTVADGWVWPVDGERRVLRHFAAPPAPYAAGHRGIDLAARAPGTAVLAATGGVVHFAGVVAGRGVVTIRSGQLLVTVEPVTATVATGDRVAAGEVIGRLETGHCREPCVHAGVREAGAYVSPLRWLGGLRRAVLLPLG